jgi:hypothetical protein
VKRPKLGAFDRFVLVGLAAVCGNWREALLLVQPETLLRWHRELFRHFWARRCKPRSPRKTRLSGRVIALIKQMATENRTWGAKRIRGELLKLGIQVAKSTIQRYIARFRNTPSGSAGRRSCATRRLEYGAATFSRCATSGSAATSCSW